MLLLVLTLVAVAVVVEERAVLITVTQVEQVLQIITEIAQLPLALQTVVLEVTAVDLLEVE
jgi:hypothetical protein